MNIKNWETDTLTLASFTGNSSSGKPTFSAQVTFKGRFENVQNRVVNREGVEVPSDARLATTQEIVPSDRVWPPGADVTKISQARVPKAISSGFNQGRDLKLFQVFF